jgi:uncharacterized membrane protein YkvA (DUF1232 family)
MPKGVRIALSVLIGVVALAYDASPLDLVPEIIAGPLGLADDAGVTAAAIFGIWKLLSAKRRPKDLGDTGPAH